MTTVGGSRLSGDFPVPSNSKWNSDVTNLERRQAIAAINDEYRLNLTKNGCGEVFMSPGIRSLLPPLSTFDFLLEHMRLIDVVATFEHGDAATEESKRDFGIFHWHGERCCWMFDYLNENGVGLSRDPTNVSITKRVVTIMLLIEFGRIDTPAL